MEPASEANTRPKFIGHLHAFRGFAIIMIVGAHGATFPNISLGQVWPPNPYIPLGALWEMLFHNSTIFFALISGLLFATVLSDRGWTRFFKSKLLYVIAPYAVFSLLFTYASWSLSRGLTIFWGSMSEYLMASAENIAMGSASFQFWYIPVLAGLFVLTPLVWWIMRQTWADWALAVFVIVPLFVSRTFPENSIANVIYFLGPYAFGVWLGASYEARSDAVSRWSGLLFGVAILASIGAYYLFLTVNGPIRASGNVPTGIDWFETVSYLQKMAIACLVLLWLRAREGWQPRWLDLLATYAFTIYFIHAFIMYSLLSLADSVVIERPSMLVTGLAGLVLWIASLAISLAVGMLAKRALGKRSRVLIGA